MLRSHGRLTRTFALTGVAALSIVGPAHLASALTARRATLAALPAPSNVDAAPEQSNEITVTWKAVPGAVSYTVYRAPHGGTLTPLANGQSAPFFDTAVNGGQGYDYAVAANDGTNDGPLSSTSDATAYTCTQFGTPGNDTVTITVDNTVYCALGGNDTITVEAQNVVVLGGTGNDKLLGSAAGSAILIGGTGNDQETAGPDGDTLIGDAGNDKLTGGTGADTIEGGAGNDKMTGGAGNDTELGGDGNDKVMGGLGDDTIDGGTGNDNLQGEDGNDDITGDSGNDHISGGAGDDLEEGGSGNDNLAGGAGADVVQGDDGNDVVNGGTEDDVDLGGAGNDHVTSGGGTDLMDGGDGADSVDCGVDPVTLVSDSEDNANQDCQGDDNQDDQGATVDGFHGTVAAYTAGSSITVTTSAGDVTFTIDSSTQLVGSGAADPQVGYRVEVEANTATTPPTALVINVETPED